VGVVSDGESWNSDVCLERMLEGIRRFFEQDDEVKQAYYSRDHRNRKVRYNSTVDLYTAPAVNRRDSFICTMAPSPPHSHDLPSSCRYLSLSSSI